MTISRLDTPLRATWDLHGPDGAMPTTVVLRVAEELVAAGLFYITLEERPLAHPALAEIIAILGGAGMQIQAVFGGSAAEWQGIAALPSRPRILVDAGACVTSGAAEEWRILRQTIARLREHSVEPDLLLIPDRQRLPLLPDFLAFCRAESIARFTLPNTRVDASFARESSERLPDPEQLAALHRVITDPLAARAGIALEVHDLFLWEIFFPGERQSGRSEYGGCQAANSLAHIDATAKVYPCTSWPEALGSLLETSFAELWQQPQRLDILRRIAEVPSGCRGCHDYALCFGGCRGLSETLHRPNEGRDLLCPERR